MTISTEVRKAGPFIGNGSASSFPFAFKVFKAADLIVVRRQDNIGTETTLVLDSDYHVTLNGNQDTTPGGVVTLVAGALASGFTLVVSSELPYLQPTDLTNQGGFYPKVITNALDRLTIFCQQLAENLGRTLKLPITAPTNISTEIPLPNPSELIAWNETGTGLTTVSPQSLVTSIAYGSATADLFAGDGVTTTFPLSTNPASVNNLDVSIGGYSQRPVQDGVGDYSWNGGASITFVTPPPAPTVPGDKNVLVRYMQAIPVSDSEALHAQTREALRRGYAEAGYNLVDGSFETGGTLASTTDVLLLESTGAAYAWTGAYPVGGYDVAPGIDPTVVVGFELRKNVALRGQLASFDGAGLVGGATYAQIRAYTGEATRIYCLGRSNAFDMAHGDFVLDPSDSTTVDDGAIVLVTASGKRYKRQIVSDPLVEWWGCTGDGSTLNDGAFDEIKAAFRSNKINKIAFSEGGNYRFSDGYTISVNNGFTVFEGNGCVISGDVVLHWVRECTMRDITFAGDITSGMLMRNTFYNVYFKSLSTGIAQAVLPPEAGGNTQYATTWNTFMGQTRIETLNMLADSGSNGYCNHNIFKDVFISNNIALTVTSTGYSMEGLHFDGCDLEGPDVFATNFSAGKTAYVSFGKNYIDGARAMKSTTGVTLVDFGTFYVDHVSNPFDSGFLVSGFAPVVVPSSARPGSVDSSVFELAPRYANQYPFTRTNVLNGSTIRSEHYLWGDMTQACCAVEFNSNNPLVIRVRQYSESGTLLSTSNANCNVTNVQNQAAYAIGKASGANWFEVALLTTTTTQTTATCYDIRAFSGRIVPRNSIKPSNTAQEVCSAAAEVALSGATGSLSVALPTNKKGVNRVRIIAEITDIAAVGYSRATSECFYCVSSGVVTASPSMTTQTAVSVGTSGAITLSLAASSVTANVTGHSAASGKLRISVVALKEASWSEF